MADVGDGGGGDQDGYSHKDPHEAGESTIDCTHCGNSRNASDDSVITRYEAAESVEPQALKALPGEVGGDGDEDGEEVPPPPTMQRVPHQASL